MKIFWIAWAKAIAFTTGMVILLFLFVALAKFADERGFFWVFMAVPFSILAYMVKTLLFPDPD